MFIYSKEPLSDREMKQRQLHITYFEEDRELAEPVLDALRVRGTTFACVERSKAICSKDDYVRNTTEIIRDCKVSVVMLSKATFAEENHVIQQVLWYEIGYMVSCGNKIILFFLDIDKSERNAYLSTTPVRQIQGTDSIDELISFLDNYQVSEKIFYDDPEINRYASRRISYVKITSLFNIYKKDMDDIFESISQMDDDIDDEGEVLNELLDEMNFGCTVMRFNQESNLGEEVVPYYPEIHTILRDYPIKQDYSKPVVVNSNNSADVYATLRAEFVIPVHDLLGVTFKPFISVNRISNFKPVHLKKILSGNAQNEENENDDIAVVKTDKEQRVYFLFDVDRMPAGDGFTQYGELLNHIWPS